MSLSAVTLRLQAPVQKVVARAGVTARQWAREVQKAAVPAGVTACDLYWEFDPWPDGDGLDWRVIDCLSDVFCVFGSFAFVTDAPDIKKRLLSRIKAKLWRSPSPIISTHGSRYRRLHLPKVCTNTLWLADTTRADEVRNFFLIRGWHIARCLAGYLRAVGSPPLKLSDHQIQDLIVTDSREAMQRSLRASGAKAVCLPGHDGAWLRFAFADAQAMRQFSMQLRASCMAHQLTCVIDVSSRYS